MQHTRPHSPHQFKRRSPRPSTDGFMPRGRVGSYQRRSRGMIPGTDEEYMISLGTRASRRPEAEPSKENFRQKAKRIVDGFRQKLTWQNLAVNQATVAIVGIMVLLFGVGLTLSYSDSPVTANQDNQQSRQNNGDTPHDKVPYNQSGYAVAANMPESITINKLGVNARITRLGVRENSEPKYPQNIYDVGWYENSATPGDEGAALLIGHIQGTEKQGVFHDLTNLVPGDEFQVEMGDGTIRNYYIVKMEAYDRGQVDYEALMRSGMDGKPGLNLLTAVGAFESNADVTQQLGVFAIEKSSFLEKIE